MTRILLIVTLIAVMGFLMSATVRVVRGIASGDEETASLQFPPSSLAGYTPLMPQLDGFSPVDAAVLVGGVKDAADPPVLTQKAIDSVSRWDPGELSASIAAGFSDAVGGVFGFLGARATGAATWISTHWPPSLPEWVPGSGS